MFCATIEDMKKSILIVEDERDMREILEDLFTEANFQVTNCSSGQEAINILATEQFNVVVLDLILPDMSGQKVLETIKASGSDAPHVVVLSAMTDVTHVGDAYKLDVADYIIKSEVLPQDIVRRVMKITEETPS